MSSHTFTHPLWVCLLPGLLALVLFGAGLWSLRRHSLVGKSLMIGGALVGVLFGPMLFRDRLVVDDHAVTHTTGFWFAQRVERLEFAEGDRVQVHIEYASSYRSKQRVEVWVQYRGGRELGRVRLGGLWSRYSAEVEDLVRARGVDIER